MSQYSIQVTFSQSLGASFNDNNGNPYTNVSGNIYLSQGNLSSIGNNAFDASMNANFKFLTILKIPDSVSLIGSYAFNSCTKLSTVFNTSPTGGFSSPFNLVLQDYAFYGDVSLNLWNNVNISSIGNYTFAGCINLPTLNITRNVITTIGNNAFDGCTKFVSFYNVDNGQNLFPITITSIGDYAFRNCTKITYLYPFNGYTISNYNISYLGSNAFEGCTSLKEFTIPYQITVIPPNLFYGCTDLSFVRMSMITVISDSAFYGCTKLSYISFNKNITTIQNNAFYGCTNLKTLTIPNFISFVGSNAFNGCSGLDYLIFHKNSSLIQSTNSGSIGYLDPSAFNNCSGLSNGSVFVYQPDSFLNTYFTTKSYQYFQDILLFTNINTGGSFNDTSIPTSQTYNKLSLPGSKLNTSNTNIYIYQSDTIARPTVIYGNAYVNNNNLIDIIIPPTITSIGDYAFFKCNQIQNLFIPNSVQTIGINEIDRFGSPVMANLVNCVLDSSFNSLTFGKGFFSNCGNLTFFYVSPGVIGDCPFFYNNFWLMGIVFDPSSNVTQIQGYSFQGSFTSCINLSTINIPDSITSINSSAFSNCNNLQTVNYTSNSSLTYIGPSVFDNCTSLTSVAVPRLVTIIDSRAFNGCTSLSQITFDVSSNLTTIGSFAFSGCPIESISIPSSVITIGNNGFNGSNKLKNVYINQNASLRTIGDSAFQNCTLLNNFTFSNSLVSIGNSAFSNDISLNISVILPNTLTTLGNSAFTNSKITSISLPKNLSIIDFSTFQSCTSLKNVTFSEGLTAIGNFAFNNCSIISLTFPSTLQTIGYRAFGDTYNNNYSLTSIVFSSPFKLTYIGQYAFANVKNLTYISLPDSLINIDDYAFWNDSSLSTVNVGTNSKLITIGNYSFQNCPKLVNFYFPATIKTFGTSVFQNDICLNAIIFDFDVSPGLNLNTSVFGNTRLKSVTISADNQFLKTYFKSPSTIASIGSNYTIYYLRAPCFLEGTKILCLNENWDVVYIPIEKIRPGMKVKTLKNGYVSVSMIGTSEMYNTGDDERIIKRLYRCPKNHYPELFEDLIMTGCHSILVDQMSYEQVIKTLKEFKNVVYMTDDKCRLIACFDERAIPYEQEGTFPIWHIALEHEDDFANYGVYANGLLVESCSKDYLIHHSGMKILEFSS